MVVAYQEIVVARASHGECRRVMYKNKGVSDDVVDSEAVVLESVGCYRLSFVGGCSRMTVR